MLEVKIKIRDNEYFSKKKNETVKSKEIKFADLGLDQFIALTKKYDTASTFEGKKKDGEAFTVHKTTANYLGEDVTINISPKSLDAWNDLKVGLVYVSKNENEFKNQDGSKVSYTTYSYSNEPFEAVAKIEEPLDDDDKRKFISSHLKEETKNVEMAKALLKEYTLKLTLGEYTSTKDLVGNDLDEVYYFIKNGAVLDQDSLPF